MATYAFRNSTASTISFGATSISAGASFTFYDSTSGLMGGIDDIYSSMQTSGGLNQWLSVGSLVFVVNAVDSTAAAFYAFWSSFYGYVVVASSAPMNADNEISYVENANMFFASPANSKGAPNFRTIVAADLPDLGASYLKLLGGTMLGKVTVVAASASGASLNVPNGTTPGSFVAGDIWATSGTLYYYTGSASVSLMTSANISGTANAIAKFTSTNVVAASLLTDNGTSLSYNSAFTVSSAGVLTAGTVPVARVSGLAASATVDTTNASNITSGTLNSARLPTSGVTAGSYGSATQIPVISVDTYGRITGVTYATNTAIGAWTTQPNVIATTAASYFQDVAIGDLIHRFTDSTKTVRLGVFDGASGTNASSLWYTQSSAGTNYTFQTQGLMSYTKSIAAVGAGSDSPSSVSVGALYDYGSTYRGGFLQLSAANNLDLYIGNTAQTAWVKVVRFGTDQSAYFSNAVNATSFIGSLTGSASQLGSFAASEWVRGNCLGNLDTPWSTLAMSSLSTWSNGTSTGTYPIGTPGDNAWWNVVNVRHRNGQGDGSTSYGGQLAWGMTGYLDNMFFRSHNGTAWQSWQRVMTYNNHPTTLAGYGITDAVSSSDSRLTDARNPINQSWYIYGDNSSGTKGGTGATLQASVMKSGFYSYSQWTDAPVASTWTHVIHNQYVNDNGSSNVWSFDIAANFGSAANPGSPENYYMRCIAASAPTGWRKLWHDGNLVGDQGSVHTHSQYQTIAGMSVYSTKAVADTLYLGINANAVSATKLVTARTIAGVSFDGTANIAIPYANLTGLPTLGSLAAKSTVTWTSDLTGVPTAVAALVNPTVNGNLKVSGNLYASSSWYGIEFSDPKTRQFLINDTTGTQRSGVYSSTEGWLWAFAANGALEYGTVPSTKVTGTIADAQIASAATWNAKQNALGFMPVNKAGDIAVGTMSFAGGSQIRLQGDSIPTTSANTLYNSAPLTVMRAATSGTVCYAGIGFHNVGVNAALLFYNPSTNKFGYNRHTGEIINIWDTSDFANSDVTNWQGGLVRIASLESRMTGVDNNWANYLNRAGGTMTGGLNFANNTWNVVGDDIQFGDFNVANTLGLRGNQDTNVAFIKYGNSGPTLGWDGSYFQMQCAVSGATAVFSGTVTSLSHTLTNASTSDFDALYFNFERSFSLRKSGTGAQTRLGLYDLAGQKTFAYGYFNGTATYVPAIEITSNQVQSSSYTHIYGTLYADGNTIISGYATVGSTLNVTGTVTAPSFAGTATNSTQLGGKDSSYFVQGDNGYRTTNAGAGAIGSARPSGFYVMSQASDNPNGQTAAGQWVHFINSRGSDWGDAGQYTFQIASSFSGGVNTGWGAETYAMRTITANNPNPWRILLHSGNYGSYALPIAGGTMAGNINMSSYSVVFGNASLYRSGDSNWIHIGGSGMLPSANGAQSLGMDSFRYAGVYANTFYEGGSSLASKYVGVGSLNSLVGVITGHGSEGTSVKYALLYTLPTFGNQSSGDTLYFNLTGGAWGGSQQAIYRGLIRSRDGSSSSVGSAYLTIEGVQKNPSVRIRAVRDAGGYLNVYLVLGGTPTFYYSYCLEAWVSDANGQKTLTTLGAWTATAPSGTTVFDTYDSTPNEINLSGNKTVTGSVTSAYSSLDTSYHAGSTYASWGHKNATLSTNYGLLQKSDGSETFLNASSIVHFQVSNSEKIAISSTTTTVNNQIQATGWANIGITGGLVVPSSGVPLTVSTAEYSGIYVSSTQSNKAAYVGFRTASNTNGIWAIGKLDDSNQSVAVGSFYVQDAGPGVTGSNMFPLTIGSGNNAAMTVNRPVTVNSSIYAQAVTVAAADADTTGRLTLGSAVMQGLGDRLIARVSAIRLGAAGSGWSFTQWCGIKFNGSTLFIGGNDSANTYWDSNSTDAKIAVNFVNLSSYNAMTVNGAVVYNSGNLTPGSYVYSGTITDNTDFNFPENACTQGSVGTWTSATNVPFGNIWYNVVNVRHRAGSGDGAAGWGGQLVWGMTGSQNRMAFRSRNAAAGGWQAYREIVTADLGGFPSSTAGTYDGATFNYMAYVTGATSLGYTGGVLLSSGGGKLIAQGGLYAPYIAGVSATWASRIYFDIAKTTSGFGEVFSSYIDAVNTYTVSGAANHGFVWQTTSGNNIAQLESTGRFQVAQVVTAAKGVQMGWSGGTDSTPLSQQATSAVKCAFETTSKTSLYYGSPGLYGWAPSGNPNTGNMGFGTVQSYNQMTLFRPDMRAITEVTYDTSSFVVNDVISWDYTGLVTIPNSKLGYIGYSDSGSSTRGGTKAQIPNSMIGKVVQLGVSQSLYMSYILPPPMAGASIVLVGMSSGAPAIAPTIYGNPTGFYNTGGVYVGTYLSLTGIAVFYSTDTAWWRV